MNRLKLVSLLIILTVVGILLGQNRELLSLKFFCPDTASESCLYQTPTLPLAAWMGIFAIAGIFSSLIWQFCQQIATPTSQSTRTRSGENKVRDRQVEYIRPQTKVSSNTTKNTSSRPLSDWEQTRGEDWETNPKPNVIKDEVKTTSTTNRVPQDTQAPSRADSVYSYKFREAGEPKQETISDRSKKSVDDVYDANYRTINNPQSKPPDRSEEDEEWI
jgi:cytoskeletal protein RodZ